MLNSIFSFILALGILVFIHELGHYAVARWFKVSVLRFSVGFGRPILKYRSRRTGVLWTLSWIPLGGYVRMLDEQDADSIKELQEELKERSLKTKMGWQTGKNNDSQDALAGQTVLDDPLAEETLLQGAFNRKPLGQRMAIVLAGPLANLILAVLLYAVVAFYQPSVVAPVIAAPSAGSPAAMAGFQSGDEIVSINGKSVEGWGDVGWLLLKQALRSKDVSFEVNPASDAGPNASLAQSTTALRQIPAHQLDVDLGPMLLRQLGLQPLEMAIMVKSVNPDSPAKEAGLQAGDRLLAVEDVSIFSAQGFTQAIEGRAQQSTRVQLQRGSEKMEIVVTPKTHRLDDKAAKQQGRETVGRLGVALQSEVAKRELQYGPIDALLHGYDRMVEVSVFSLIAMGKMVTGSMSLEHLSGPIGIASAAGQSSSMGLLPFIAFLGMVSVSLGVLNLLPIPLLDGGHLLYYVAEFVRGKPLSESFMLMGQKIGVCVIALMASVALFNDIQKFF